MNMKENGQALLEYVLMMALAASLFFSFYNQYKDRLLGEDSFIQSIIKVDNISTDFKRFRIIR